MNAEFYLPIFKQGDDLANFLRENKGNSYALKAYAGTLELAAGMCRSLAEKINGKDVEIDANTHCIHIEGPDEVIEPLIQCKLLAESSFEDDEDE